MKSFYREVLKAGKDIKWLSKEIGVSSQTVYSWKLGKSKPKTHHMHKISKVLKMDIDRVIDDFHKPKEKHDK
jgi:DNA-binding XRE family transcriptional regulator